jgi:L-aspartate oxidase
LKERFPRIYATCKQYGVDITAEPVPVRPAAHYLMGGIKTDLEGRSTLPGLYAAGETACTGVHGANRLASNSLLEGLVFGARVAEAMRQEKIAVKPAQQGSDSIPGTDKVESQKITNELRQAMWAHAGVIRNREGLQRIQGKIADWQRSVGASDTRSGIELRNLLTIGKLIVDSALAREESRGAHFRSDFPEHDDAKFRKHSIIIQERISFA